MPQLNYLSPAFERVQPAWRKVLPESVLVSIDQRLNAVQAAGQVIYPPRELTFNALSFTAPENVRIVILGQDPYHGDGQAMGMSFSVPDGVKVPPSLRNIYKELQSDIDFTIPRSGNLSTWAQQGVLLLNSVFTVQAENAGSHGKFGWQAVSDVLIDAVNTQNPGCVFMLWGNWAIGKADRIDTSRHLVLTAAHPSPLAAKRGFFGCRHFSQANDWLAQKGRGKIDWSLPEH